MENKAMVLDLARNDEYQPLLTGQPQTRGMRSGRVFLKAGQECGLHSTKAHEEILVFLGGQGTARVGDPAESLSVRQGKILYIPPHTPHNIVNSGTEPLVYIYCVAPVGPWEKNE
ncbi:MAG: cupin domain-containing protein [Phycisphaerae bacterium]|nr:cupin domain-containing protein [Phycisphaerae bacterium]